MKRIVAALVILTATCANAVEIQVNADLGPDVGQNFGTLFEARAEDGSYTIGAGFLGLFNTYHRSGRHVVQFFVRPADETRVAKWGKLPRPGNLAGTYMYDFEGDLYATHERLRMWDAEAELWRPADTSAVGMPLGSGVLSFSGGVALYDGTPIIDSPERGRYTSFYYAHGHLIFYHTYWADQEGYRDHTGDVQGFTKLYACPWKPGDEPIDASDGAVYTLPFVGETPFAWGQLREDALTCSNIGGVYVFNGASWRTVVDGSLKTSYQVYSMLNFGDDLILAQYPTGELFRFDGFEVTRLDGWPPRMPGVSGSAREAQTTTIYGGELYVGVWPWAEVWKYHPDTEKWTFVSRLFTHPEPTSATTHPYQNECGALGGVANLWGQRVTSAVTIGPDLIFSTSAKSPLEWEPKYSFVDNDRWKEYGSVHRMYVPGNLSVYIDYGDGNVDLRFSLADGFQTIEQNRRIIARHPISNDIERLIEQSTPESPANGKGIFGAFGGRSIEVEVVQP